MDEILIQLNLSFVLNATLRQSRCNLDKFRCHSDAIKIIANFCSSLSLSFGQVLGKLQGKVVTQFEELGWWSFSMVDCVTLF